MRLLDILAVLSLLAFSACSDHSTRTREMPNQAIASHEVVIRMGELGEAFSTRYPRLVHVQHQPAGIDFYSIDWDARDDADVVLDHGPNTLHIAHVLGIQAPQDLGAEQKEGLSSFSINAGLTASDVIGHDEARHVMYGLLRGILNAGWQQVIDRSQPRLSGKARQDYTFATSNLNGLDATYLPELDDWMRIKDRTPWNFYANGLYLEVSMMRDQQHMALEKPGAYLLTFKVETTAEYFRSYADPLERQRWEQVLPGALSTAAKARAAVEEQLKAKGVPIDERYKDPPVPELK